MKRILYGHIEVKTEPVEAGDTSRSVMAIFGLMLNPKAPARIKTVCLHEDMKKTLLSLLPLCRGLRFSSETNNLFNNSPDNLPNSEWGRKYLF